MSALRTSLPADELESLRKLSRSNGAVSKRISAEHGERLVRYGLARIQGGGLTITATGYAKLAIELTRASWVRMPK